MRNKIFTATFVLAAAVSMTACSGATSATPTQTVTVTAAAAPSSSPSAASGDFTPPPGAGVGGASVDMATAAKGQAREFVTNLTRSNKAGALALMTKKAAVEIQSRSAQTILGVNDEAEWKKGCQLAELMPLKPNFDFAKYDIDTKAPNFQAVLYKVLCTNNVQGVLVTTEGEQQPLITSVHSSSYMSRFSDEE